ncbi:UNVERIFIED_CONTAM: hypothetical protein HDU68_000478 [Siphonaria sp. JEL0065]|nr:hypothetical protein HDU68_000478 [Siphonaria sp. JEL0065]
MGTQLLFAPFFLTQRFADAVLLVSFEDGGEPQQRVPVHRIVLASQSPVLDALFESTPTTTTTSTTASTTTPLVVGRGCTGTSLRLVLEWLYFGHTTLTLRTVFGVLKLAADLKISALSVHSKAFVLRAIDGDIVVDKTLTKVTRDKLEWQQALAQAVCIEAALFLLGGIVHAAVRDLRAADNDLKDNTDAFIGYSFIRGVCDMCSEDKEYGALLPAQTKQLLNLINYEDFTVAELEVLEQDVHNDCIPKTVGMSALMLAVKRRDSVCSDCGVLSSSVASAAESRIDNGYLPPTIPLKDDTIRPIVTHPTKRPPLTTELFTPHPVSSQALLAVPSTATTLKQSESADDEEEFHDTVESLHLQDSKPIPSAVISEATTLLLESPEIIPTDSQESCTASLDASFMDTSYALNKSINILNIAAISIDDSIQSTASDVLNVTSNFPEVPSSFSAEKSVLNVTANSLDVSLNFTEDSYDKNQLFNMSDVLNMTSNSVNMSTVMDRSNTSDLLNVTANSLDFSVDQSSASINEASQESDGSSEGNKTIIYIGSSSVAASASSSSAIVPSVPIAGMDSLPDPSHPRRASAGKQLSVIGKPVPKSSSSTATAPTQNNKNNHNNAPPRVSSLVSRVSAAVQLPTVVISAASFMYESASSLMKSIDSSNQMQPTYQIIPTASTTATMESRELTQFRIFPPPPPPAESLLQVVPPTRSWKAKKPKNPPVEVLLSEVSEKLKSLIELGEVEESDVEEGDSVFGDANEPADEYARNQLEQRGILDQASFLFDTLPRQPVASAIGGGATGSKNEERRSSHVSGTSSANPYLLEQPILGVGEYHGEGEFEFSKSLLEYSDKLLSLSKKSYSMPAGQASTDSLRQMYENGGISHAANSDYADDDENVQDAADSVLKRIGAKQRQSTADTQPETSKTVDSRASNSSIRQAFVDQQRLLADQRVSEEQKKLSMRASGRAETYNPHHHHKQQLSKNASPIISSQSQNKTAPIPPTRKAKYVPTSSSLSSSYTTSSDFNSNQQATKNILEESDRFSFDTSPHSIQDFHVHPQTKSSQNQYSEPILRLSSIPKISHPFNTNDDSLVSESSFFEGNAATLDISFHDQQHQLQNQTSDYSNGSFLDSSSANVSTSTTNDASRYSRKSNVIPTSSLDGSRQSAIVGTWGPSSKNPVSCKANSKYNSNTSEKTWGATMTAKMFGGDRSISGGSLSSGNLKALFQHPQQQQQVSMRASMDDAVFRDVRNNNTGGSHESRVNNRHSMSFQQHQQQYRDSFDDDDEEEFDDDSRGYENDENDVSGYSSSQDVTMDQSGILSERSDGGRSGSRWMNQGSLRSGGGGAHFPQPLLSIGKKSSKAWNNLIGGFGAGAGGKK